MIRYTRLAQPTDIDDIMLIIQDAKIFLKKSGSSQWQSGYPDRQTITEDIQHHHGYVLMVGPKVVAYAAVVVGVEPTYRRIDGSWHNDTDSYATIHRLCISAGYQGQGLAKLLLANLLTLFYSHGIRNFRVDTFRLNQPMQKLAKNFQFEYRGNIAVDDDPLDPKRLAFELNL